MCRSGFKLNPDSCKLPLTNSNVLGKLAIRDLNNWVIQELLLADLAKTQYTRDDEGPYIFSHKP